MSDPVLLAVDGAVGTVTFNRPEALNAMDLSMTARLAALAEALPALTELKILVLRGAGPSFMAGGDIQSFAGPRDEVVERLDTLIGNFHAFVLALHRLPIPVIALVQGAAAGAGFSLAIGCDMTIAAENAQFIPAYRMLGTTPDGGGTFFLREAIGPKRAMGLLLAGKALSPAQALDLGLVNRVVPAAKLDDELASLVATLTANAVVATAQTKALLRTYSIDTLKDHLQREKMAFLTCAATDDFAEGVAAFLAKRPPKFGRG